MGDTVRHRTASQEGEAVCKHPTLYANTRRVTRANASACPSFPTISSLRTTNQSGAADTRS